MITGSQIRAARALLRISISELAARSKVAPAAIRRAESTAGEPPITIANLDAVQRALESAGVEFIGENGEGIGARLRMNANGRTASLPPEDLNSQKDE